MRDTVNHTLGWFGGKFGFFPSAFALIWDLCSGKLLALAIKTGLLPTTKRKTSIHRLLTSFVEEIVCLEQATLEMVQRADADFAKSKIFHVGFEVYGSTASADRRMIFLDYGSRQKSISSGLVRRSSREPALAQVQLPRQHGVLRGNRHQV